VSNNILVSCLNRILQEKGLSASQVVSNKELLVSIRDDVASRCPDVFSLSGFLHALRVLAGSGPKTRRKDVPFMTVLGAFYVVYRDERLLSYPALAVPVCCATLDRVVEALETARTLGFDPSRVVGVLCVHSSCCERNRCIASLKRVLGPGGEK